MYVILPFLIYILIFPYFILQQGPRNLSKVTHQDLTPKTSQWILNSLGTSPQLVVGRACLLSGSYKHSMWLRLMDTCSPDKCYFVRHYLTHSFLLGVKFLSPGTEIPTRTPASTLSPSPLQDTLSNTTPVPSRAGPGPSRAVPHKPKGLFNTGSEKSLPLCLHYHQTFSYSKTKCDHHTRKKGT